MSYILEALRKAERERNVGQVPDLTAVCALPPPAKKRVWPWLLLVGALGINAAVLVWVFMPHERSTADPTAAPTGTTGIPQQAMAPPSGQLTAADFAAPAPPAAPKEAPAVAAKPPPPIKVAKQEPPSVPESPKTRRAGTVRTEPLDNPPMATRALLPESPPVEEPRPLSGKTPASRRPAIPSDPPLSPNYVAPELSMDVHVYSEQPNQRFVLINSRRYREGEQLKEGPVVEAITREGALLRYGEQRFMLTLQH
ncbi:MAG: general secretion pathway protein GspB [Candidatus Competibacteraceae bacterium]